VISIIKQIQASITSEAKWLTWVWRKNAREKQNIQDKAPTPHKPSHKNGKYQSPPQISKVRRIKGFGEDIDQLSLSVYESHLNDFLLYVISQEVVSPLKVPHSFVEDWVLTTEMVLVLSHIRETLSNLTPRSLMVCTIHEIWEQQLAAVTYSASVVDWETEDCFWEDQQMREDPRKWQVSEVIFWSIPQPTKSA
jgi:hypothetical protein